MDNGVQQELTKAELEMMQVIWDKEKVLVHDILDVLPEPKPAAQMTQEDVIEAEQKKKSVLKKLQEAAPEPEKVRTVHGCIICGVPERA